MPARSRVSATYASRSRAFTMQCTTGASPTMANSQGPLTDSGIPVVGFSDATSANSFQVQNTISQFVGMGVGLAKDGCKKVANLYQDGFSTLADGVKQGAETAGAREVARASFPANAPDLAPAVAKLMDANPQCIALAILPTAVVQAVTAIKQTGKKVTTPGDTGTTIDETKQVIPPRFNRDTTLTAEIKPASNTVDYDLKSR